MNFQNTKSSDRNAARYLSRWLANRRSFDEITVQTIQNCVLALNSRISSLCCTCPFKVGLLLECWKSIFWLCSRCGFSLSEVVSKKITVNRKKYNACLVQQNKPLDCDWKELSHLTGFTDNDRHSPIFTVSEKFAFYFKVKDDFLLHFPSIASDLKKFAAERNWLKLYNRHNLSLSLLSEIGELATVLQFLPQFDSWKTVCQNTKNHIAMEIADVALYLMHYTRKANVTETTLAEI